MTDQHDDFDTRLRERLASAENRIPEGTAPTSEALAAGASPRWMRPALVALTAASAVVLTGLLIGQLPDLTPGAASPSPDAGVQADSRSGDVVLTLSSPQSVWTTNEAIEIVATISLAGEHDQLDLYGGGGPIVFGLLQRSGGDAETGGAQDLPCIAYSIGRNAPLVVPYAKSGIVEGPPFDAAFFNDPELHLPSGRWEVRATFHGSVGECSADAERVQMEVSIEIAVVAATSSLEPAPSDSPAQSAEPTPSAMPSIEPTPAPTTRACATASTWGVLGSDSGGNPILVNNGEPPIALVWSDPDRYRIETEPVLTIFSQDGELVATHGDFVEAGGGYNSDDTVFSACGITRYPYPSIVDCYLPVADCDAALNAAGQLIASAQESNLAHVTVGWGRGLRWHAEVHACFEKGQYELIDVLKTDDGEGSATYRENPPGNPPCD